jgi:hypothetical protein
MIKRSVAIFIIILIIVSGLVWKSGIASSLNQTTSMLWSEQDTRNFTPLSTLSIIKVRAFPLNAIAARDGKQTIFILVQDRIYNPIPNVEITLIVRMPGGEEARYIVQEQTNEDGFTQYTFPYSSEESGNVVITVSAKHGNMTAQTSTSFTIWW